MFLQVNIVVTRIITSMQVHLLVQVLQKAHLILASVSQPELILQQVKIIFFLDVALVLLLQQDNIMYFSVLKQVDRLLVIVMF